MSGIQFIYHKGRLSKSLLTVTVFLSCFAFTGQAYNSAFDKQQATQTEITFLHKPETTKHTVLYKKILGFYRKRDILSPINTLLAYNRLIKVRISAISKKFYLINTPTRFMQTKTVPQSSSESSIPFLLG